MLQLGCGLDSRVYWIDPPPGVLWFDVGYRNVIGLRQKLYPERAGCRMIGLSVTEPGWLDEVPGDRPGWITAEGLTHYLSGSDVETLLNRLTGHFSAGRMAFDAVNRLDARLARNSTKIQATGANIGCWLDDTHDIKLIDLKLGGPSKRIDGTGCLVHSEPSSLWTYSPPCAHCTVSCATGSKEMYSLPAEYGIQPGRGNQRPNHRFLRTASCHNSPAKRIASIHATFSWKAALQ
ncbi:MAG: hypothetical protein P8189_07235 [Anaerolineae bacterium]